MRKSNGHLHYYINGQDQGIAATETPTTIWGVVDLYGMAVKVTILDRNDPSYNLPLPGRRTTNIFRQYPDMYDEEQQSSRQEGTEHCQKNFHITKITANKTGNFCEGFVTFSIVSGVPH